jgi:hypothetical protein
MCSYQEYSLRYFLTNPYYVMMGLMGVMMFAMPKLMDNMDPEARALRAATRLMCACVRRER